MLYVFPLKEMPGNNGAKNQYLLSVSKGSSLLGCDPVLLGEQLLTFQRTVVPSSSGTSSLRITSSFLYLSSLWSEEY
jgi:hypothetical protein